MLGQKQFSHRVLMSALKERKTKVNTLHNECRGLKLATYERCTLRLRIVLFSSSSFRTHDLMGKCVRSNRNGCARNHCSPSLNIQPQIK